MPGHVVLVDNYAPSRRLAPALVSAGCTQVHVQSSPRIPEFYRRPIVFTDFKDNIIHRGDFSETLSAVAAYRPVAVVAGGEAGVEMADALSAALRLPSSNGTALSTARRDKYRMIERIKQCGLRGARQLRVDSADELAAWHSDLGGRVVVKPPRSSAGDGVFFCETPEESGAAYHALLGRENIFHEPNVGVIAQEYLYGAEYLVNTVSHDGNHHVCDIWKTSRISANGIRDMPVACHLIARHGPVQNEIVEYSYRALNALGVRYGPAHVEIKLTPSGPYLMELGARICGLDLPGLTQLATGESQIEWTVDAYVRPDRFLDRYQDPYRIARYLAWAAMVSPVAGTLTAYRGLDEIRSLESFRDLRTYVEPGGPIAPTVDDLSYPMAVILEHEIEEVVLRDLNTLRYLDGVGFYELKAT